MQKVQNELGAMQPEIARLQEEEKKWMLHYQTLQVAAEEKRKLVQ
jgi:hypothetical protein